MERQHRTHEFQGKEREHTDKKRARDDSTLQVNFFKDPKPGSRRKCFVEGSRLEDLSRRRRENARSRLSRPDDEDDFSDDNNHDGSDDAENVRESLRKLSAKIQLKRMEDKAGKARWQQTTGGAMYSSRTQRGHHRGGRRTDSPHIAQSRNARDSTMSVTGHTQSVWRRRTVHEDRRMDRDAESEDPELEETEGVLGLLGGLGGLSADEEHGQDVCVFYMQTEEGAMVGPLNFEVDDIRIRLPSAWTRGTQEDGLRNRQTGSHGLNEFSSRSHSVLTITIDIEAPADTEDDNLYFTKRGKLSFVDLAGSEKVKDGCGAFAGPGILEANSINKSLLVLGKCISHLGDSKRRQGHIPYRDSKLTKLLSDSLGGNGITLMIACIAPSAANITETMSTLRYASRAKKIRTKASVKLDPREKLILSLKREIKILRNENQYLRQQLDFPDKPKGELQKENDEKFLKFVKEQKEKESGLYEMLQEYMVENENLRFENSEMHSLRDRTRREQQLLYRENEKLLKRVEELERVLAHNPSAIWALTRHHERADGYAHMDLPSSRTSPITAGAQHVQKGHSGQVSPPASRGKPNPPLPMKPPHRLSDPVSKSAQRPAEITEIGTIVVSTGLSYPSPLQRQNSPTRNPERMNSQLSSAEVIHSMNEQLKREVAQLEGEIRHHQYVHERAQEMNRNAFTNSVR